MSASKIPAASAIAAASVAPVARLTVDEMVAQLDGRPLAELFKILKATTALAEKGSKSSATKKGTKKKSDVPMTAEEEEKAASVALNSPSPAPGSNSSVSTPVPTAGLPSPPRSLTSSRIRPPWSTCPRPS